MKHAGTKTIETGRLVLRPFRIEDAQPMYENWASDPEVTKFLMWPGPPKRGGIPGSPEKLDLSIFR